MPGKCNCSLNDFCDRVFIFIGRLKALHSWKAYEHPEGGVYFYNKELRLVTVDNILDPMVLKAVLEHRLAYIHELEHAG